MIDLQKILVIGQNAVVRKVVQKVDTAGNYSTGLNELLATPACVDIVIRAAVEAVQQYLPEGFISVGQSLELTHEQPTCLGMTLNVKAVLTEMDGNRLTFDILVWDELGEIGRGRHTRAVVNRDALLKKAKDRKQFLVKRSF